MILLFLSSLQLFSQPSTGGQELIYEGELCKGDSFQFGEYTVEFCGVVVDSRCPDGVTCVRAGEAKVKLEFFKGDDSIGSKIISSSGISLAEIFLIKNINVAGFTVNPYPEVGKKIKPNDYRLWLRINQS